MTGRFFSVLLLISSLCSCENSSENDAVIGSDCVIDLGKRYMWTYGFNAKDYGFFNLNVYDKNGSLVRTELINLDVAQDSRIARSYVLPTGITSEHELEFIFGPDEVYYVDEIYAAYMCFEINDPQNPPSEPSCCLQRFRMNGKYYLSGSSGIYIEKPDAESF